MTHGASQMQDEACLPTASAAGRWSFRLYPAERMVLAIAVLLCVWSGILIASKGITLDPGYFSVRLLLATLLIALGQIYRRYRPSERVALMAHATGLFIIYATFAGLFNVALLPRPFPAIDPVLVEVDAMLGYSWPEWCARIADYPVLSAVMRTVYQFTHVQLLLAFLVLGVLLDRARLHVATLAAVFASLATIFTWAVLPSTGPGGYWLLDPAVDAIVRPLGSSALGAELNRLLVEGVADISTLKTTGLVGFPSFHTAMGLIALFAVWPYPALRYPTLLVSVVLAPAILAHGGHHLADVLAGIAVTLTCWQAARRFVDGRENAAERRQNGARPAKEAVSSPSVRP